MSPTKNRFLTRGASGKEGQFDGVRRHGFMSGLPEDRYASSSHG